MRKVIRAHRKLKHPKCRRLRPAGIRNYFKDELGVVCKNCCRIDVLGFHAMQTQPPDPRSWWDRNTTSGYPSVTVLLRVTGIAQMHSLEIVRNGG